MEVYEKIRFLRESKNWSQDEMAEKLNMSLSGYSKIELGDTKISIPKLKKIAEVLGIELIELMFLGEKHIAFLVGDSNSGCNIIGSTELAFELQKQQLIIELKDKELAMKDRENDNLREIIALLKREPLPSQPI